MQITLLVLAASGLLTFGAELAAQDGSAPATAIQAAPAKQTRAPIYDETADAAKQIDLALAKARLNNRRVLIQWGANWCGWCHLLHERMKSDSEIAKAVRYEYDVVLVDVGRFDKNMDIAARYDATLKDNGIPFITVLDGDGRVLANQETGSLESPEKDKPSHDSSKVLAFLKQHQATPRDAQSSLATAAEKASKENKRAFVHFGAPWCGWCHRLEDWMARPDIAPILAKEFIDCPIDVDRDTGGQDLLSSLGGAKSGIPWTAFVNDPQAKPLATSEAPTTGNIGFPYQPGEVAHFETMLRSGNTNLTDEDIATLVASLNEIRTKDEAGRTGH